MWGGDKDRIGVFEAAGWADVDPDGFANLEKAVVCTSCGLSPHEVDAQKNDMVSSG
jgi:hypothetical protein